MRVPKLKMYYKSDDFKTGGPIGLLILHVNHFGKQKYMLFLIRTNHENIGLEINMSPELIKVSGPLSFA